MRIWRALCLLALCCAAGLAQAQFAPLPLLAGHVNDDVGMLTTQQRTALERVLTDYERRTGSQIVLLLVSKTEPEAIEQYSIRVMDKWKLGRKGVDDGVLLLVARDNPPALRRLRIETGRGVQGVLTDAQAKRILQDVIAPHFRQDQFYDGIVAGVSAIETLLDQEALPAPTQPQRDDEGSGWLPLVLFIFLILGALLRPRRRALGQGGWGAGMTGFILGSAINSMGRGGGGGGGYTGGGGTFDGGGASGNW